MRRIVSALAVMVPIAVAGSLAAHHLGYVIEAPAAGARSTLMRADGHTYLTEITFLVPAALTVFLAGCMVVIHQSVNTSFEVRAPVLPFAVSPAVVFVMQESAERVAAGAPIAGMPTELSFACGLLLQLPFALLALWVAKAILRTAVRIAKVIGSPAPGRRRRDVIEPSRPRTRDWTYRRFAPAESEAPGRAPPRRFAVAAPA